MREQGKVVRQILQKYESLIIATTAARGCRPWLQSFSYDPRHAAACSEQGGHLSVNQAQMKELESLGPKDTGQVRSIIHSCLPSWSLDGATTGQECLSLQRDLLWIWSS